MPKVMTCVLDENRRQRCSVLFPMYTFHIKVKCADCSADRSSKELESVQVVKVLELEEL